VTAVDMVGAWAFKSPPPTNRISNLALSLPRFEAAASWLEERRKNQGCKPVEGLNALVKGILILKAILLNTRIQRVI
jgi:hypothetical protein